MKKRILLSLLICILISVTVTSCEERNKDRFNTEETSILVGEHRFTFPKNYSMSRDNGIFSMTLLLPDFLPRTRENEELLENPSYNKNIQIVVGSGDLTIPFSPYFSDAKKNKELFENFLVNSSAKYKASRKITPNLDYYEALSGPENINIDDLYVYHENNDIQFILECPAKVSKSTLADLCTSRLNIFGNLLLKYWYPMQYLPDAFEIHNKIKNLLLGFHNGDKKK